MACLGSGGAPPGLEIPLSLLQPTNRVLHIWMHGASNGPCVGNLYATNPPRVLTLAWDGCTNATWTETNYLLEWTYVSLVGTQDCGTNMSQTIALYPARKTNQVITITTVNATNIRYRPPGGTWFLANATNLTFTNPVVSQITYQPMGARRNALAKISISRTVQ